MSDVYASCPCGSGKKFKWCCQPIYAGIQKAESLFEGGQHEMALKAIDAVCEAHPDQPHAWGKKAELLFMSEQADAAEQALEKAFSLNPQYGFGLFLRARLRFEEGEMQGGLLLARKAAEVYSADAADDLAAINRMIFNAEWSFRRPLAARAALEQAVALQPAEDQTRQALDGIFGDEGGLPLAARRKYDLAKPADARRQAWNEALAGKPAKLGAMAQAYDALTQQDPADAPAWFNLGLVRAWLGDNKGAVEALESFIEKTTDDKAAEDAAALGEVLRCGMGMDEQCDYVQHVLMVQLRNPQPIQALLQEWAQAHRLLPLQAAEEGEFHAFVVELTTASLVTVGSPAADAGRFAGELRIGGPFLQMHCPVEDTYARLKEEMRTKLGLGLTELKASRVPPSWHSILSEAMLFLVKAPESDEKGEQRTKEYAARFFEDTWTRRPRKSLGSLTPLDASAGSAKLRRKLAGVIDFHAQCAEIGTPGIYDFDRLRRKLGLGAAPATASGDYGAMGPAELAALKTDSLDEAGLEQAYHAAQRVQALELAANFAEALLAQTPPEGKTDRYPFASFLITKALADGDTETALGRIDEGMRIDCESNGGKRRDDYEMRRAAVHIRRGEADAAEDVFTRLIQRTPDNLPVRGKAAEAMLNLKQPAKALKFAEEGLAAARAANDRDAEGYLNDLAGAARRQGG